MTAQTTNQELATTVITHQASGLRLQHPSFRPNLRRHSSRMSNKDEYDADGTEAATEVELDPKRATRAEVRVPISSYLGYHLTTTVQIITVLGALRKPQVTLEERFIPGVETDRPPLMHYGIALSADEIMLCAERLNIAPEILDCSGIRGVVQSESGDPSRSPGNVHAACDELLVYLYKDTKIGKAARRFEFRRCVASDDRDLVLSFCTNYSHKRGVWGSPQRRTHLVEQRVAEILVPGGDSRSCFKWHWDSLACGYG